MANDARDKAAASEAASPGEQSQAQTPPAPAAPAQTQDRDAPRPFPERVHPRDEGETHTRDEWKEHAVKFGVSSHHIAGALAHHDPAEAISRPAVEAALESFRTRRGA